MGDLHVPHRLIKVLSFDKTLHGLCGHETGVRKVGRIGFDMRCRGVKFVGSTTVYAFHQAASYIDAHGPECNLGKRRMS